MSDKTRKTSKPPKPLISNVEAAEILGHSATTVRRWADEGLLPEPALVTPRGHPRYRRSDIERLAGTLMKRAS